MPRHGAPFRWPWASVAALALWAVGGAPACPRAQTLVPSTDLAHPRVQYEDSLTTLNDRCPVRQGKLNPSHVPVYVNGRPIGFC